MKSIDTNEVSKWIQKNIDSFHKKRIEKLDKIELKELLGRKNPYLFKAKYFVKLRDVIDLIAALLDARLSSSEETLFGDFLEDLAVFVNCEVYGGSKSSAAGIDLEFEKDDIRYIVSIKSGPNWGNSDQVARMKRNFSQAKQRHRRSKQKVDAVNGCCYGRDNKPDKGEYLKLCGQKFWSFISGNDDLYTDIIEPLGHEAKKRNEAFNVKREQMINKFTKQFTEDFCDRDGNILWEEMVRFNSEDLTKEWMTTKEAAECLNISIGSVLKRIGEGELRAMKYGNRWLVHKSLLSGQGESK